MICAHLLHSKHKGMTTSEQVTCCLFKGVIPGVGSGGSADEQNAGLRILMLFKIFIKSWPIE